MELRHLSTFQMIVKEGSFLRAAEKLQYAQSTITLHIQQLEAELGIKLFARQGKRVQLTEAGRALRDQADSLLQRAQALQQSMKDIVAGEAGHLRLGSIEPTASVRLSSFLVDFLQRHPKVHLTLEVGGMNSICQRVASGQLDIGICSAPPLAFNLNYEPLFVEKMVLLLPVGHPLAEKTTIHVSDLLEQQLLLTDPGCAYRAVIEQALLAHGTYVFSGIEIGSVFVLQRAVQSKLGIAIVPRAAVNPIPIGTVWREIDGVKLELSVGFVQIADSNPPGQVLQQMVDSLRTYLKEWGAVPD